MAVLRRYLWDSTNKWDQDWWDLCYDDEKRSFYVEHRWDHANDTPLAPHRGNEHISITSFTGPCWWLIDDLEDQMLEEAGHD